MKSIWKQYRLSTALDEPGTPFDPGKVVAREEHQAFARDLATLNQALKAGPPEPAFPPFLHQSVMAKVRLGAGRPSVRGAVALRWWTAPACAAVLIACFFTVGHFARRGTRPAPAPEPAGNLATLPGQVLSPLADELEKLRRDFEETTEFLVASMP